MRNPFRICSLTVFMLVLLSSPAWAVTINSVFIDYSANQMTINGAGFSRKPVILFNGIRMTTSTYGYTSNFVNGTSGLMVITGVPTGSLTPGTYKLKVINPVGQSATFYVTYGFGPQGLTGPQGPAGAPGLPNTIQILSGFQDYTTNGTFIVPQGINYVLVEMCGGGGGGGYQANASGPLAGGGGGGGYVRAVVPVTPGDSIPITVGTAGSTPNNGDGLPGGDSRFGNILYAGGGQGGQMDINGGKGGAGGFVTGGVYSYIGGKGRTAGYPVADSCFGSYCVAMEKGGMAGYQPLMPDSIDAFQLYNYGVGGWGGVNLIPAGYSTDQQSAKPGIVRVSW